MYSIRILSIFAILAVVFYIASGNLDTFKKSINTCLSNNNFRFFFYKPIVTRRKKMMISFVFWKQAVDLLVFY